MASTLGFLGFIGSDPAPSVFRSKDRARTLECEFVSSEFGRSLKPGRIEATRPRGDFVERDALLCRQRLIRPGIRSAIDEALLADLEPTVREVAALVAGSRADLADRTWLVEVFVPNPALGTKAAFAQKVALMQQGLRVSDRLPLLSATDLEVVLRLPPAQAYPAACRRWHDTAQLREDDVLLSLVLRDLRETTLHAGLCLQGQWVWMR